MKTNPIVTFFVLILVYCMPVNGVAQTTHDVTVGNNFFSPANLTIQVGDTVRWTNAADSGPQHNVTGNGFASVTAESFVFSQTFTREGIENYLCTVHPATMTGTINVEDDGGGAFDLELDDISVDNDITYQAGDSVAIETEVENDSDVDSTAYTVNYYLSNDAQISSGDTLLGSSNRPSLDAGENVEFTVSVNLPGNVDAGSYFIGGIIDVNDANNSNNVDLEDEPITVQGSSGGGEADLSLTQISVNNNITYQSGEPIAVETEVTNVGNADSSVFVVNFYVSENSQVSANDILLGSSNRPALGPGNGDNFTTNVNLPGNLATGSYFIGGIIDSDDASSANNVNQEDEPITVQGSGGGGFELNPGHNGNWWFGAARNGEGVQIEVSNTSAGGRVLVATMYSYNLQGKPIFLLAVGDVISGEAAVEVFIFEGPVWGPAFDPANLMESPWETGLFTYGSCDAIHMVLTPNATFVGMGYSELSADLVRLTLSAVPCPLP